MACLKYGSCFRGGNPSPGVCKACKEYEGPPRGLGDMVSIVAQPVAKIIDKVAGTNIKGCSGCQKRREKLNNLLKMNSGVK